MHATATATNENTSWIGQFEVLEQIKRGGMATLYRARRYGSAGFTRVIALKVLHDDLAADERFLCMFFDEARISSRLSHPNIVRVEELGSEQGLHYLAMEYIDGCSVNDLLKAVRRSGRVLSPELAIYIISKVAEGLHDAHQCLDEHGAPLGLIHRDISPSNILLSRSGHVKLIDFGIAKAEGRLGKTQTGYSLKGKLRYMAPEQAMGEDLDRRADIYSLGVVLWELLAGRQLFTANTEVELYERITTASVTPPSVHNPAVSAELDQLVLSMLSLDPEGRPASADDVRRLLKQSMTSPVHCDSDSVAQVVETTLGSMVARSKRPTSPTPTFSPTPIPRTPIARAQRITGPMHGAALAAPVHQESGASRAGRIAVSLFAAVALAAAAVVAGLWISAAIGQPTNNVSQPAAAVPAQAEPSARPMNVEDGSSLSGEKTDRTRSQTDPTTPERGAIFSASKSAAARVVAKPAPVRKQKPAAQRPAFTTAKSSTPIASSFDTRGTAKPKKTTKKKATSEKVGSVNLATEFD